VDISSLVFVDDNPAERELVRQQVPEVTVVELPPDPSHFARQLDEQHFFDAAFLSQEDLTRASSYSARRRAIELQAQASDLDSYLRSLEMRGAVFIPEPEQLKRLAQMELKTNQFNVTTRRYLLEALNNFAADPKSVVLAFTLVDRFANHGLV